MHDEIFHFEIFKTIHENFTSLVPKLLPVENCVKMHPKLYHFADKNDFLPGKGPAPFTTPYPSTPTAPRALFTEILHTQLPTAAK